MLSDQWRMSRLDFTKTCAFVAAIWLVSGGSVEVRQAQAQAQEIVLEEVIVTARKRDERLLDIPFGLTALSAAQIERYNFKDLQDVQSMTPGFFFAEFGAGRNDRGIRNFVIRGLNVGAFVNANDAAIVFVDGAPVVSGEVPVFSEVERIEVLRGPQSAYFGRNTFSGAINVITRDPADEWQGKATAEWSSPGSTTVSITGEGPIIENRVRMRVGAYSLDKQGDYFNTVDGSRLGDRRTESIFGTIYLTPSDNLSIKIYAESTRFDDGPGAHSRFTADQLTCDANGDGVNNWICGRVPAFPAELLGVNLTFDSIFIDNAIRPRTIFSNSPFIQKGGLAKRMDSIHGILTYEFENGIEFKSVTAFHDAETQIVTDEDNRDTQGLPTQNPFRNYFNRLFFLERAFQDLSQELRFTSSQEERLRWTVGGSYVRPRIISGNVVGELNLPAAFFQFTRFPLFKSEATGLFGGVYYDITDQLTVSAESRYQIDDVTILTPPNNLTAKFKSFAPRLTVEFKPNDDLMLFANWSRGFRPGAFNSRFVTLPQDVLDEIVRQTGGQLEIDEERMDTFEFGLKGSFLDRRASVNLVGYFGNIANQQITAQALVDLSNTGFLSPFNVVVNTGKTDIKGAEFEGAYLVPNILTSGGSLQLSGTFAWNEVTFKEFFCTICVGLTGDSDASGNQFPKAPKYTGSFDVTYSAPLSDDVNLFVGGEYLYRGNIFANEANLARSGAMHTVNLRVGLDQGNWRIEAFATNLTNNKTYHSIERQGDQNTPGSPSVIAFSLRDKSNYGVRTRYNF